MIKENEHNSPEESCCPIGHLNGIGQYIFQFILLSDKIGNFLHIRYPSTHQLLERTRCFKIAHFLDN
jgi:hypothetical protein